MGGAAAGCRGGGAKTGARCGAANCGLALAAGKRLAAGRRADRFLRRLNHERIHLLNDMA
ncbi:hypothetical protein C2I19_01375 [Chromobacterium alticapitis]|uniref:Uncharacterized protein n=1 Tax=Chromobacterium alticapitis TaxID=2073169 RepID=A0A2S5DL88_9NEIS|nr:hypothetical protein C2I19_01375 [Chromobacterium alticapitis]